MARRASRPALLGVLLATCALLAAAQEYGFDYTYDTYYDDYKWADDTFGYYSDDDTSYYEYFGHYADDALSSFGGGKDGGGGDGGGKGGGGKEGADTEAGMDTLSYDSYYEYYDDYFLGDEQLGPGGSGGFTDCVQGEDGKVKLANGTAPCDLRLEGLDKQADLLTGGIDGLYKLVKCHNGKPMYQRQNSTAGEDRVLWYSNGFGDWDISKGLEPNEKEILLYGGEVEHASTPLFASTWHLGADLMSSSEMGQDDYTPVSLSLKCADGKVYKPPADRPAPVATGPVLTDSEIEAKYRFIYEQYGRRPEPNPSVNFTFVVMLVMMGLTIVLAIPYFLLRKRSAGGGGGAKSGAPIAASFATVIQQGKKKQSGHMH